MTIADKLALLEQTKEAQRVKLGLPESVPFSQYVKFIRDPFTPAELFANGEQGVWLDPSDLSTMFQDVDGTEPVTKDGDPVALIRDKSGNDNHATQATATRRPIYRTDGSLHWLEFDGVGDYLEAPFKSTDVSDFILSSSAMATKGSSGTRGLACVGYNTLTAGTTYTLLRPLYTSSVSARGTGARNHNHLIANGIRFTESIVANAHKVVFSATGRDEGIYEVDLRGAATNDEVELVFIGTGLRNAQYWQGRIYGTVLAAGDGVTVNAKDVTIYLDNKAGVTL